MLPQEEVVSLPCDNKKSDISNAVATKGNSHRDIPLDVEINCGCNVADRADGYADEAHSDPTSRDLRWSEAWPSERKALRI